MVTMKLCQARLKILAQRMAQSRLVLQNVSSTSPVWKLPWLGDRQMGVDSSGMPTDPKAFTFEKARRCLQLIVS